MAAYYNEIDPLVADWLRNLISAGHLPEGEVDGRDIRDVKPRDLEGFTQAHFFAGIGGWPLAFRLAGWSDERPVWTGSCPCQPFSNAGALRGVEDERHLWPVWRDLIAECRPPVIFGEQVASAAGRTWLASVRADLEDLGYAVGAADLCAAGVGAPHIRQRLFFGAVADAIGPRLERHAGDVGHWREPGWIDPKTDGSASESGNPCRVVQSYRHGRSKRGETAAPTRQRHPLNATGWDDLDWLPCQDGKTRPTQPGLFPLADGVPGRVGRVRAYGNAIVPRLAAAFVRAFMEAAR